MRFGSRGGDMRIFVTVLALLLSLPITFQLGRGDDKQQKERWEELEKELAQQEANLEKDESTVRLKQFIAKMTEHLDKADRISLFRLDPEGLPEKDKEGKKEFHGYEIVSSVVVEENDQRKETAAFLGKILHWNEGRKALCFNPRHGLRVVSGSRTLDFLICFECHRVRIYEGQKCLAELATTFTDESNPIEKCLAESEKKAKNPK
jgi:hypothetical protein